MGLSASSTGLAQGELERRMTPAASILSMCSSIISFSLQETGYGLCLMGLSSPVSMGNSIRSVVPSSRSVAANICSFFSMKSKMARLITGSWVPISGGLGSALAASASGAFSRGG